MSAHNYRELAAGIRIHVPEPVKGQTLNERVYAQYTLQMLADILDKIADDAA